MARSWTTACAPSPTAPGRPNTGAAGPSRGPKALKAPGPVPVPREFVFMDRAAIGLGGVFLHLRAELNFHRLFEAAIADFSVADVGRLEAVVLAAAGVEGAAGSSPPPLPG